MASERDSFVFTVLSRALLLALLLTALVYLLGRTQYYATALLVILCSAALVAELFVIARRQGRAAGRFLDALAASDLETPVQRSAIPASLRIAYDRTLERLREDRRQQQQQREYLQTLLDTVPAGLLVLDTRGGVEILNRAAHRLLGEAAASLAELSSLGPAAARQLNALLPGTHRILQTAGAGRLLASATQFTIPGDSPRRLISLQRLAGDLDAVELAAWDDMARVLAHEMMNSLTPIASLSQSLNDLLRTGSSTREVVAALETITRRSQGLLRFVERYRQVAHLPEPQKQALVLEQLLEDIDRLIQPSLEDRHILLEWRVTPPHLVVQADPDLLEQALINLLRNAADASAGSAQPRISLLCRSENGQTVIEISDNGPGLTATQLEQIFVPFFTTKPAGSGIGLSLARRIAQAHGGSIAVTGNQPQGSVFRLSLPAEAW
ncbi:MAG: ATP-binding protein [Pseudomonadota bacterium]|nr:ATP-binding protein [Pseudomonadota bacterium]